MSASLPEVTTPGDLGDDVHRVPTGDAPGERQREHHRHQWDRLRFCHVEGWEIALHERVSRGS